VPAVTVATPLTRNIADQTKFWGQFSAVDRVEIRAQVGGTLSEIHFKDGQIVHQRDLLFVIDPQPYEIALNEAAASVKAAEAHLKLSKVELWRAQQLKKSDFGSAETVDQREADQEAAEATLETARQTVADAELNLTYCHVTAPFTGKISNHQVSVGNLVSGSRAGTSPTTLLTTIVSLDPIYLDFDMSESEYLSFLRARASSSSLQHVSFRLTNETSYSHTATLDFIDNSINKSSGTIHVRATVQNPSLEYVPGEFAYLEVTTRAPYPALLIPDSAITPDQSEHFVMTVGRDGSVVPKKVTLGGTFEGLRIVRTGLSAEDRVVLNGFPYAVPGAKVRPQVAAVSAASTKSPD